MSIEQSIAALTAAVIELTNAVKSAGATTVTAPPAPVTPAPVMQAPAAPAMPAPPMFAPPAAPAPAPAPNLGAPFSDGAGLIAYVMGAYKEMGPQKGAQIQSVLTSMGYQNINDVKPEHYGNLYQGVEALKRG
jgi:hypothetical protein